MVRFCPQCGAHRRQALRYCSACQFDFVAIDPLGADAPPFADDEADALLPEAVRVVEEYDRASASLLQRRLKIGYARAARMIDQLESRGYLGRFDGSNARQVLRREVAPGRPTAIPRLAVPA